MNQEVLTIVCGLVAFAVGLIIGAGFVYSVRVRDLERQKSQMKETIGRLEAIVALHKKNKGKEAEWKLRYAELTISDEVLKTLKETKEKQ